jgi:transformer-2 protein
MYDPHTRESRGFGFVTMESAEEADAAIAALNATDLMGKVCNVEKVMRITTHYINPNLIN